jgi:hypothetical protein
MPFEASEITEQRITHPAQGGGQFTFTLLDRTGMGRVICTLSYATVTMRKRAAEPQSRCYQKPSPSRSGGFDDDA